jgi:hypothetical protein
LVHLEAILNQIAPLTACPQLTWKELVETVIFETDSDNLPQRIQDAQDAIMDEIEDSFSNCQFKRTSVPVKSLECYA